MQWMVTYNRLGERQLHVLDECLENKNKCHFIYGFAGSGKTVLLLHAIKEFRDKNPQGSVCVVVFTHALIDLIKTGIPDHLNNIPVMTRHAFEKNPRYYDLIVVDEIQDLNQSVLPILKKYSGSLIVAGDENQSIYKNGVTPEDIQRELSPNKLGLEVLYRLTQVMRNIVKTILPNSGIESARSSRMAQVQIVLAHGNSESQEVEWAWQQAKRHSKIGDPVAIIFPQKKLIDMFINKICEIENIRWPEYYKNKYGGRDYTVVNKHFALNNIDLQYLGNQYGSIADSDHKPLIYLMTYHSAKGLDFETVFLPFLNDNTYFWSDDENLSRRLFFVAATRSRKNLFLSHNTNAPHAYVQNMPQDSLHKVDCEIQQKSDNDNEKIYIF